MSTTLSFLIRDGVSSDIPACLSLDHTYDTEYVWQMRLHEDIDLRQIVFQAERLPRTLEATYPADEHRLRLALPTEECFLVVESRDQHEILGYLTLRSDPVYYQARLQDLVVSRPYRRNRIGTRLLAVARQWARQHELTRITAEVQTPNYPAIQFCQHTGLTFCGFNDHYFPNRDIAIFFTEALR
ncbi:MAG: GNAT family N-acetyltransferase [Anaerolineae bacterium]|nr:GNAT family N-acetyltransferase [Anaerolineae bacterium]